MEGTCGLGGRSFKKSSALRGLLSFHGVRPFDTQASFELYQKLLKPVEDVVRGKPRLSLVVDGALSSLPPQLLVTRDPTGKALNDVDWLLRAHAVTVLPSVASLKVLRGKSTLADAGRPLIGFADPVFDQRQRNVRVAVNVAASRGIRGSVADIAELRTALPPLPETADELRKVAASVHANPADVIVGPDATESASSRQSLINTALCTLPPTGCSLETLRISPSSTPSLRWCCRCPSIRPSSMTAS